MSRSYRYPIFKDAQGKKAKRASNKKVRSFLKTMTLGCKSSILKKKCFNSINISDWKIDPKKRDKFSEIDIEKIQKATRK